MKYFGIGLSRTGTKSLYKAFKLMGFNSKHYLPPRREVSRYDFVNDLPIPMRYKKLDQKFPGSKFIYTVRDTEAWLKSCKVHFSKKDPKLFSFPTPPRLP